VSHAGALENVVGGDDDETERDRVGRDRQLEVAI
jgi:hypothetical protein